MTAAQDPDTPARQGEHGVLLSSGLVCPAASRQVAAEQAARLGGTAVRTGGEEEQ